MKLEALIESIPGFPKEGIIFRDVTPILEHPEAMNDVTKEIVDFCQEVGATAIVAPEARGFLFGVPAAMEADLPFYPVRKPGKLPRKTITESYELEYGTDSLQMHEDSVKPGDKVVIVDDLLATGGTMEAIEKMVKKLGGTVAGIFCIIELDDLKGKDRFEGIPFKTMVHYAGE